jgi:pimeloyl-ACP methyl ester carboxylesterase
MKTPADSDPRRRPPVLFVSGVGLTAAVALRSVDKLRSHFEVLTAPASTGDDLNADDARPASADDAIALLDADGVEQAHVIGLSFGAAIAQELAIRHPARVRSLVLCSSSAGGDLYVPPAPPIRYFIRRLGDLPIEEGLWSAVPYLYAPQTLRRHAPLIGQDIARRLRAPLNPRGYSRQRSAARSHDAGPRLGAITAPTLVIHGEQDRILPPDNGRLLADCIASARLLMLPRGGHAFPTDVPAASRELISFLLARSKQPARRAPRNGHGARA